MLRVVLLLLILLTRALMGGSFAWGQQIPVYQVASGHGTGHGLSAAFAQGSWFFSQSSSGLKYTECNGNLSSCTSTTLDSDAIEDATSIIFFNDQPHIAYYDTTTSRLKHAYRTSGGWGIEDVDSSGSAGGTPTLIQCGARLCIVSYNGSGLVRLSYGGPGNWSSMTVDSGSETHPGTSIAADSAGNLVIVYLNPALERPKVATLERDGGSYDVSLESVAHYTYTFGAYPQVEIDKSSGTVHISALGTGSSSGRLFRLKRATGISSWTMTDDLQYLTGPTSMALHPTTNIPWSFQVYQRFSALFGSATWAQVAYPVENEGYEQTVTNIFQDTTGAWHTYERPRLLFNSFGDVILGIRYAHNVYFSSPAASTYRVNQPHDGDGDGLPDYKEPAFITDEETADSDGDTLSDGVEVLKTGTNPLVADSDGDALSDANDPDAFDIVTENLIADGSMSSLNVLSWQPYGAPYLQKTVDKALRITADGASAGVEQAALTTSQSANFFLQLRYRRISGTATVRVGWGSSSSDFEGTALEDSSSSGWQTYTRSITTPLSAGDLRLVVTTDGVLELDDVLLIPSASADADSDSILDSSDNCPSVSNTSQTNSDADSQGDLCDADDDNDGVLDVSDCSPQDPTTWRTTAFLDADNDDVRTDDTIRTITCSGETAPDGYTYATSAADNCPSVSNGSQTNTDSDSEGNACDSDDDNDNVLDGSDCDPLNSYFFTVVARHPDPDNDEVPNALTGSPECGNTTESFGTTLTSGPLDNCPGTANADQADADADAIGDACDSAFNPPTPTPSPTPTPPAETPSPTPTATPGPTTQTEVGLRVRYLASQSTLQLTFQARDATTRLPLSLSGTDCSFALLKARTPLGTAEYTEIGRISAGSGTRTIRLRKIPLLRGTTNRIVGGLRARLVCADEQFSESESTTTALRAHTPASTALPITSWFRRVSQQLHTIE